MKKITKKIISLIRIASYIFSILIIIPIRIFIIFLNPIISINFAFTATNRFGSLALDVPLILGIIKKENKKRSISIIVHSVPISNNFFFQKIKESKIYNFENIYFIKENWFFKSLKENFNYFQFLDFNHIDGKKIDNFLDAESNFFAKNSNFINLNNEENKKGVDLLKKLNIDPNKPWICFHNRDSEYLKKTLPDADFSYHNYRDFDVETMLKAAEYFAEKNYSVLRVGEIQKGKFQINNPSIIDYANSNLRSEFADIFLLSNCKAYFGSDSGVHNLPLIKNIPIFFINISLTILTIFMKGGSNSSRISPYPFIFKNIFDPKKNRNLTLSEIFDYNLFPNYDLKKFNSLGLKLISNSKEEIYDFSKEVLDYLGGNWKLDSEDIKFQEKFWKIIYDKSNFKQVTNIPAPIGKSFLKKYSNILN